jgi:hypothetical protein
MPRYLRPRRLLAFDPDRLGTERRWRAEHGDDKTASETSVQHGIPHDNRDPMCYRSENDAKYLTARSLRMSSGWLDMTLIT